MAACDAGANLLAADSSLIFRPSREARCCSRASRRELGAWGGSGVSGVEGEGEGGEAGTSGKGGCSITKRQAGKPFATSPTLALSLLSHKHTNLPSRTRTHAHTHTHTIALAHPHTHTHTCTHHTILQSCTQIKHKTLKMTFSILLESKNKLKTKLLFGLVLHGDSVLGVIGLAGQACGLKVSPRSCSARSSKRDWAGQKTTTRQNSQLNAALQRAHRALSISTPVQAHAQ